jgi:mannitol-specific phosphotransferase system IIBC component
LFVLFRLTILFSVFLRFAILLCVAKKDRQENNKMKTTDKNMVKRKKTDNKVVKRKKADNKMAKRKKDGQ